MCHFQFISLKTELIKEYISTLLINYDLIAMEDLGNRFRVSDEPLAGDRQVKCIHSSYYRLHNVVNTNSKMLGVA